MNGVQFLGLILLTLAVVGYFVMYSETHWSDE